MHLKYGFDGSKMAEWGPYESGLEQPAAKLEPANMLKLFVARVGLLSIMALLFCA